MIIKELAVGMLMANCIILGCEKTREAAVIDPGDETERILLSLKESKLILKYIINTHGHFDHVGGNKKLKEATGADILIHFLDAPMLSRLSSDATLFGCSAENSPPPDRTLEDNDIISFGEIRLKVIHTPGHSPGGISLYIDDKLFVGDTLFARSIGRSDLPGGDFNTLISSIKNRLFELGDDVKVFPGHGPNTTIGREKLSNPFVQISSN
ncbi:MAG: MBL fold metallo-hydrolase [Deltaproteobacteria bacterium]|nr:MBL fold metallo-hydrolase [Deltaproteobacteria bacterium]